MFCNLISALTLPDSLLGLPSVEDLGRIALLGGGATFWFQSMEAQLPSFGEGGGLFPIVVPLPFPLCVAERGATRMGELGPAKLPHILRGEAC